MMATEPQPPIDDALPGKFLAGEASPTEAGRVRRWLTDPAHQREFTRYARIWNAAGTTNRPDTVNRRGLAAGSDADAPPGRSRSDVPVGVVDSPGVDSPGAVPRRTGRSGEAHRPATH